ncbi:MAG: trans-2-enoyl-CoA reductase family protein [Gammaproteobacteria bacterium]|nr:trans-2-enoyl-CoA reductase family protein [Gammaproteobacteria bacterium]
MIIKPRIRGFICTTAHPIGCAKNVQDQVNYVRGRPQLTGSSNALIVGCSAGYGLASRISAAFGCGANTIGVSFEKDPTERKTGSAGWYNNAAFDRLASSANLFSHTINDDAFADHTKTAVIEAIRNNLGSIDLLIYSLAAPIRTHPKSDEVFRSSIKPIGQSMSSRTLKLDVLTGNCEVSEIDIDAATDEEIRATTAVMGGEDWEYWIEALSEADVLAPNFRTVAYTYLGNELTWPIYRGGTIGKAKEHLDETCHKLNTRFGQSGCKAFIAVLKAVVTQASTAIPVVPLYFSILFQEMKSEGTHEDCIDHIHRLFQEQLYPEPSRVDDSGRIRMDNFELDEAVQARVAKSWERINSENVHELADVSGFQADFLRLFGFGHPEVNYDAEVSPVPLQG